MITTLDLYVILQRILLVNLRAIRSQNLTSDWFKSLNIQQFSPERERHDKSVGQKLTF